MQRRDIAEEMRCQKWEKRRFAKKVDES